MVECCTCCNHYWSNSSLMNLFGPYTKQIPFQGGINAGIQPKKHGRGRTLGLALADRCSTDDAPQRSAEAARPAAAAFGRCARGCPQWPDQRHEGRQGEAEIPRSQDRRYLGRPRRAAALAERGIEGRQEAR